MSATDSSSSDDEFLARVVEAAVRIGTIVLLGAWCFQILRPFVIPVMWGVIIAVAVFPAYRALEGLLGGRGRLAAGLFTTFALLLLIVPTVLFAGSLVESGHQLAPMLRAGAFEIPAPPDSISAWPLVGDPVHRLWSLAHVNLHEALSEVAPQLRALGTWLLAAGAGTGLAFVQFVISIIIAGVLLANATGGGHAARNIATRLAGDRGETFANLAGATVRSVAVGIVGVALIQSTLVGLGLFVADVPHAPLWTVICVFVTVLQLSSFLVVIPASIYLFSYGTTTVAVLFTIWGVLAGLSDNVLKPVLLARGVDLPMIVIFMGAIGGFLSAGFVGLFVGAVVLALGYELFVAWLDEGRENAADAGEAPA